MRISKLVGRPVFDASGKSLGRLHELEADNGTIVRLVYGKAGLFERLTGRSAGTKRPWSDVARIDEEGIHLSG